MLNECLFILQILLISGFALAAFKMGKEALIAWISIQAIIANLFVLKQITLFGFEVTASDAYIVGSLLGLNFLQEHFGREEAQKATWICFFFMFFFALISQLHLAYIPSLFDYSQGAFNTILKPSPRLFIASLSVFFIVQQFDIRFFNFIRKKFPNAKFAWRMATTLVFSQFLDTFLFSFAGLYGIVASITDIILISFLIKLTVIFCSTSVIRWVKA